jgi:hypothetical protein
MKKELALALVIAIIFGGAMVAYAGNAFGKNKPLSGNMGEVQDEESAIFPDPHGLTTDQAADDPTTEEVEGACCPGYDVYKKSTTECESGYCWACSNCDECVTCTDPDLCCIDDPATADIVECDTPCDESFTCSATVGEGVCVVDGYSGS